MSLRKRISMQVECKHSTRPISYFYLLKLADRFKNSRNAFGDCRALVTPKLGREIAEDQQVNICFKMWLSCNECRKHVLSGFRFPFSFFATENGT